MIAFLAALIIQKTYIYAQDEDTVNYDSLIDEADYSGIDSTLDDYGSVSYTHLTLPTT